MLLFQDAHDFIYWIYLIVSKITAKGGCFPTNITQGLLRI
jgi:hypothetical protein